MTVTTKKKAPTTTGTIRSLNKTKGFGFIQADDSSDEFFFHFSALKNAKFEELRQGQGVTFEETEGKKGPRAEEIYVDESSL